MSDTEATLPSFKEQLAIVYDDHMATLGGGERSALAYALALQKLDFTVEIVTQRAVPGADVIARTFGDEFRTIPVRRLETKRFAQHLAAAQPAVFVNHTFMNFESNPAKIGIYSQMFPVTNITARTHPLETRALATYHLMLSNSSFTKKYTDARWDYPITRSHVLHPPIGSQMTQRIPDILARLGEKKRQFVHVGRFNPGVHNKNQKIVIEAFLEARRRFAELKNWSLLMIGNANQDSASLRYLADCKDLAARSGGAVGLRQDAKADDLVQALAESFGYVHGTGAFLPPGEEPFKCEHFGLSIVEAMASACIPLVYARGGIFDVLEPGRMGIPYMTPEGLVEGFQEVAQFYGSPAAAAMQVANTEGARRVGFAAFLAKLAEFIGREMLR